MEALSTRPWKSTLCRGELVEESGVGGDVSFERSLDRLVVCHEDFWLDDGHESCLLRVWPA